MMQKPLPIGLGAKGERKAVTVSVDDLVKIAPLQGDSPLPVEIRPSGPLVDLPGWLRNHRGRVERLLEREGAVLFRGFGLATLADFEIAMAGFTGDLLEYSYRSTPRTQVSGRIYTSTEYPAEQQIPMHNEMSYTSSWPGKIWFFCTRPAETGGETPIADSRRVYDRIPVEVRERFERDGVLYQRNFGHELDLPWQTVFQTEDPAAVESFCRSAGLELEWRPGGRLRTRQVCQATARHPRTGERVWFNQAHLFHVSSLAPEVHDLLLATYPLDELPRNTYYGDGTPIGEAALAAIREAYRAESVAFRWQQGDLLMLDNMLVAHGRMPYRGARQILVGMAESMSATS